MYINKSQLRSSKDCIEMNTLACITQSICKTYNQTSKERKKQTKTLQKKMKNIKG